MNSSQKQPKVLILAEHDKQGIKPNLKNLLSAAKQLSDSIVVLLIGNHCDTTAESVAKLNYVQKVTVVEAPYFEAGLAEEVANCLAKIASDYTHVLAAATSYGKNILPRVAALLEVGQVSEVIQILSPDTFVRPMYAGNVLATVQALDPIKLITVRQTAFDPISETQKPAPIDKLPPTPEVKLSNFLRIEKNPSTRPELNVAKIVISGGRGLQSRENFKMLEEIADKLGAAVGASRAAVDAGFVPNEYQVGQTGKVVAPDLYIAVGISGAIQHLSGMKDSKIIVAINKDADAPIFQIADYGLIGDLFQILPELNQELTIRQPKK